MKSRWTAVLLCASMALTLGWARAEENTSSDESAEESTQTSSVKEKVTVVGTRPAYRGEFSDRETPQAEQTIDQEVLVNAGALDLNQALDLSASVARQNNFGGLWNSFAVRGFVGDENEQLPGQRLQRRSWLRWTARPFRHRKRRGAQGPPRCAVRPR